MELWTMPPNARAWTCFSYANYEPSVAAVFGCACWRGAGGESSADDAQDMASGQYEVQDEDLPIKQIYQCDRRI